MSLDLEIDKLDEEELLLVLRERFIKQAGDIESIIAYGALCAEVHACKTFSSGLGLNDLCDEMRKMASSDEGVSKYKARINRVFVNVGKSQRKINTTNNLAKLLELSSATHTVVSDLQQTVVEMNGVVKETRVAARKMQESSVANIITVGTIKESVRDVQRTASKLTENTETTVQKLNAAAKESKTLLTGIGNNLKRSKVLLDRSEPIKGFLINFGMTVFGAVFGYGLSSGVPLTPKNPVMPDYGFVVSHHRQLDPEKEKMRPLLRNVCAHKHDRNR